MQKLIDFLKRPFPEGKSIHYIINVAIGIGIFVASFLFFFKPFGLHQIADRALTVSIVFGLISCVIIIVYELISLLLGIHKDDKNWTTGKWLISTLGLVLCIAAGNYYYAISIQSESPSFKGLASMLISTFAVAIFPVTFIALVKVKSSTKTHKHLASSLAHNADTTPNPEHKRAHNQLIEGVPIDDIRVIQSMQNYVNIVYLSDDLIKTELVRRTLSDVEQALQGSSITRCHRSYLVNQDHITDYSGNAQGLQLSLSKYQDTVPVSRKYVDQFR